MNYTELKKQIKKASQQQMIDGLPAYISYAGDKEEHLISNFVDVTQVTDNQLIKAEKEGLLVRDWDTYEVV